MPNLKLPSYDELTHDDWAALSEAVLQFEALWQQTTAPSMRQFLRSEGDPLRLRLLIELVRVDQERRWERGDRKQVEDYLQDWPELGATPRALAELLQSECLMRFCLDDAPSSAEVSQRFPQLVDQVDLEQLRAQASDECRPGSTEQNEATATYHRPNVVRSLGDQNASRGATRLRIGHMTGQRFGRYEIRRLVATGGMGVVYEARDTELNRVVALKIPRADMLHDRTAMQRFVNEARAAAVIRHPHVCPIFDVGEIDGQQFLTMPLVDGISLSAWIENRTVAPREAVEVLRKLASAVQAVHDAGIRHRDIKASNVMIDQRGEPLLMDFGLARVPQSGAQLTHSGSLIGTPAYMAPEQIHEGATGGDERSDVYSLGVLLFQLLTGRLPFEGPITRVLVEIATREPPTIQSLRPDVDTELATLCHKAMSRQPTKRFQTAREFEKALDAYLRRLGTPARPAFEESVPTITRPADPKSVAQESLAPQGTGKSAHPTRRILTAIAAAAFVILAGIVISIVTDKAELVIVAPDKGVEVSVRHVSGTEQPLTLTTGENNVRVRSGTVEVVLTGAQADQYEVGANRIVFTRGDRKIVEITRRQLVASRERTAREGEAPAEPSARPSPLTTRPSPWDQLDPKHIPPSERVPRQPEGLVAVLGEHRQRLWEEIHGAAVSLDGSQFAVTTETELRVWHRALLGEPQVYPLAGRDGLVWLSDGRIAIGTHNGANTPGMLQVFSTSQEPGQLTPSVSFPDSEWTSGVAALATSRDGRWIAGTRGIGLGQVSDGISLWGLKQNEGRVAVNFPMPVPRRLLLTRATFSPDSRWLCIPHASDGTVRIVDLQPSPPTEVATLHASDDAPGTEPAKGFFAAAFLSDGRLATCDGKGQIWLWTVSQEPTRFVQPLTADDLPVDLSETTLFAASQSKTLVFATQQKFFVWDLSATEPRLRCRLRIHQPAPFQGNNIMALAVVPDGRSMWTGHLNRAVRFWDISGADAVEHTPLPPNPITYNSGATGDSRGPFVLDDLLLTTNELGRPAVWQIEGGTLVSRPAPADGENPIAELLGHSGDGRYLTAMTSIHSPHNGMIFRRNGVRFEPVRDIAKEAYHNIALNHDGSRMVIAEGGKLELFAFEGTRTRKLAEGAAAKGRFGQIAFLDDQHLVMLGSGHGATTRVQLWDIQPNAITLRAELPEDNVWQFAISPDGHTLATGGAFVVKCWDLHTSPPSVLPAFANRTSDEALSHFRNIGPVAFSPDGRTLAANTHHQDHGHGIDLIDVATGETKQRLAYPGPVRNIQFTPDGRHLVTANGNSTIYVVRLESLTNPSAVATTNTKEPVKPASKPQPPATRPVQQVRPWSQLDPKHIPPSERVPRQPEGLVSVLGEHQNRSWYGTGNNWHSAAVAFDGSRFAMARLDGLYVWNRNDLTRPRFFGVDQHLRYGVGSVTFLRDGRVVVTTPNSAGVHHIVGTIPDGDGPITWTASFPGPTPDWGAWSLTASPDGRWLIGVGVTNVTRSNVLWDMTKPEPVIVASFPCPDPGDLLRGFARTAAFSPDSQWLSFVDASDLSVRVIDLHSAPPREAHVLRAPNDAPGDEPSKGFLNTSFVSDGRLVTADNNRQVWLWQLDAQQPPKRVGRFSSPTVPTYTYLALIPASQSPVIVVENHDSAEVWDLSGAAPKLRCRPTRRFDEDQFSGVSVSPDGRTMLTGHRNGAMRFWDISGSEAVERVPLPPNPTLALSGSAMYSEGPFVLDDFLLATDELYRPNVWQIEKDQLVRRPAPSDGDRPVSTLMGHSADGRFLATSAAAAPPGVIVFRRDGHRLEAVRDINKEGFQSATLNHDGSRLAIGTGPSLEVWGFENARSRKLAEATINHSVQIAFLNDQRLVTRTAGRIYLWDIQPPELKQRAELPDEVHQFALSSDGHTLATGGPFVVKCWDLRTSPPSVLPPYANPRPDVQFMGAVAISPDGRTLAASSYRHPPLKPETPTNVKAPPETSATTGWAIDLIDVATGESKRRLAYPGPVRNIQFTPDGRHLVTANGNSTIYVVRLP